MPPFRPHGVRRICVHNGLDEMVDRMNTKRVLVTLIPLRVSSAIIGRLSTDKPENSADDSSSKPECPFNNRR